MDPSLLSCPTGARQPGLHPRKGARRLHHAARLQATPTPLAEVSLLCLPALYSYGSLTPEADGASTWQVPVIRTAPRPSILRMLAGRRGRGRTSLPPGGRGPVGRGPPGRGPGRGHGQAPLPPRAPPVPVPTEDFNFEEGIQRFNKEVGYSGSSSVQNMRSALWHLDWWQDVWWPASWCHRCAAFVWRSAKSWYRARQGYSILLDACEGWLCRQSFKTRQILSHVCGKIVAVRS